MPKAKKAPAPPKQDETKYALDVAFSSDTEAFVADQPIAMAYGFAHDPGNDRWIGDGQRGETIMVGNDVYFSIFDTAGPTAEPAASLTGILITFTSKGTPFEWATRSIPPDEPLPKVLPSDWSTGCNVRGRFWRLGPYKAVNITPSNVKGYECSVRVTMKAADGKIKTFRVDPEMIIKGG